MTAAKRFKESIERMADALERLAPPKGEISGDIRGNAFVWQANTASLKPVKNVNRIDLSVLRGIDRPKTILFENTRRFAQGLPANNALLWGAKGMGKSYLVKAVHKQILDDIPDSLALIEIHREDILNLPELLTILSQHNDYKFILLFLESVQTRFVIFRVNLYVKVHNFWFCKLSPMKTI